MKENTFNIHFGFPIVPLWNNFTGGIFSPGDIRFKFESTNGRAIYASLPHQALTQGWPFQHMAHPKQTKPTHDCCWVKCDNNVNRTLKKLG